jgi:hypothetical protein
LLFLDENHAIENHSQHEPWSLPWTIFPRSSPAENRVKSHLKFLTAGLLSIFAGVHFAAAAETTSDPMAQIKGFLVVKLQRMDAAAHDYVANANAYQAIIDKWAGDYDRAAIGQGPELLQLITKMQDDYRVYHNHGYETIEGITAGTNSATPAILQGSIPSACRNSGFNNPSGCSEPLCGRGCSRPMQNSLPRSTPLSF